MDVALPRPQRGFLQISGSKHLTEDGASKEKLCKMIVIISGLVTSLCVCLYIWLCI